MAALALREEIEKEQKILLESFLKDSLLLMIKSKINKEEMYSICLWEKVGRWKKENFSLQEGKYKEELKKWSKENGFKINSAEDHHCSYCTDCIQECCGFDEGVVFRF